MWKPFVLLSATVSTSWHRRTISLDGVRDIARHHSIIDAPGRILRDDCLRNAAN
jgi:hypothetical protein